MMSKDCPLKMAVDEENRTHSKTGAQEYTLYIAFCAKMSKIFGLFIFNWTPFPDGVQLFY
ncbi:MAG: hypothetical protein ACH344_07540 [Yersinia sp. (in: enterobacteria)]